MFLLHQAPLSAVVGCYGFHLSPNIRFAPACFTFRFHLVRDPPRCFLRGGFISLLSCYITKTLSGAARIVCIFFYFFSLNDFKHCLVKRLCFKQFSLFIHSFWLHSISITTGNPS